MRMLTWFVPSVGPGGADQREAYRLDGDYIPGRAWVHLPVKVTGEIILDIKVDGVSLFGYKLRLHNDTDADSIDFASVQLSKDAIVTLNVDQGEANNMTVGLDLEEA